MDMDSRSFPRGGIRVSDADRDRAVAELSEHFQSGRLTQDEFEDRSGTALQARTGEDLSGLFTDLPHRGTASVSPAADNSPSSGAMPPVPPMPRYQGQPHTAGPSAARMIIGFVIAAIIAGNVFGGNVGHGHGLGWLVPVIVLAFVFLRLAARRR
jgi:Domain of unknown function (DUF1707)